MATSVLFSIPKSPSARQSLDLDVRVGRRRTAVIGRSAIARSVGRIRARVGAAVVGGAGVVGGVGRVRAGVEAGVGVEGIGSAVVGVGRVGVVGGRGRGGRALGAGLGARA